MTTYGYARVSTVDQDPQLQRDALLRAGIAEEHIFTDHASGAKTRRPQLDALLALLQPGDVLVVWKLDRLGRSLSHLIQVVDDLGSRGIEFRSLTEAIDTTTPAGRLLFSLVASVAEFERSLVAERTKAALAAARAKGKPLGRPTTVNKDQFQVAQLLAEQGRTQYAIARATGLSRATVGRLLRGEIARTAAYEPTVPEDQLPLHRENP